MSAIAVISYSSRSAGAADADEYWRLLKAARPQFAPVPSDRWKLPAGDGPGGDHKRNGSYSNVMAAIEDPYAWDRKKFKIPLGRARRMDPQQRMALTLTDELLERYGENAGALSKSDVATIIGVSSNDYRLLSTAGIVGKMLVDGSLGYESDDGVRLLSAAQESSINFVSGHTMPGFLANMVPATVQSVWDFQGPAFSVDAACASSLIAINQACDLLELRRVKTCIAGGLDDRTAARVEAVRRGFDPDGLFAGDVDPIRDTDARPECRRRGTRPRASAHGSDGRHVARVRHRVRVRGPPGALRGRSARPLGLRPRVRGADWRPGA
jgi:acyl transferase domain-containing protein